MVAEVYTIEINAPLYKKATYTIVPGALNESINNNFFDIKIMEYLLNPGEEQVKQEDFLYKTNILNIKNVKS